MKHEHQFNNPSLTIEQKSNQYKPKISFKGLDNNIKLSIKQKFIPFLKSKVFLSCEHRSSWNSSLPKYAFRYPNHGILIDYPHGCKGRLDHPLCECSSVNISWR